MDNSKAGWIGWIIPALVLITFIAVIVMGVYDYTSNNNKESGSIGVAHFSEYIG